MIITWYVALNYLNMTGCWLIYKSSSYIITYINVAKLLKVTELKALLECIKRFERKSPVPKIRNIRRASELRPTYRVFGFLVFFRSKIKTFHATTRNIYSTDNTKLDSFFKKIQISN